MSDREPLPSVSIQNDKGNQGAQGNFYAPVTINQLPILEHRQSLAFANIMLAKDNPYWRKIGNLNNEDLIYSFKELKMVDVLIPDPYSRAYKYHFHSDVNSSDRKIADPSFDITLLNEGEQPCLLIAIGVKIVSASMVFPLPGGGSGGFKVPVSASHSFPLPNLWERLHFWQIAKRVGHNMYVPPIKLQETIETSLADPIYLSSAAPFRFTVLLEHYQENMPNGVILQFFVQTQERLEWSQEIYLSKGSVRWHEEDLQSLKRTIVESDDAFS